MYRIFLFFLVPAIASFSAMLIAAEGESEVQKEVALFDPRQDGNWETEVFHDQVKKKLQVLIDFVEDPAGPEVVPLSDVMDPTLRVSHDEGRAYQVEKGQVTPRKFSPWPATLRDLLLSLRGGEDARKRHFYIKVVGVRALDGVYEIDGLLETSFRDEQGASQTSASLRMTWKRGEKPKLIGVSASEIRQVRIDLSDGLLVDRTSAALAGNEKAMSQFARGVDWRVLETDRYVGTQMDGLNGLSVVDLDGDFLEDVFVCQTSGIPNRLFQRQKDGSLKDVTETSGLAVLDSTYMGLFVDLDSDGDKDALLAVDDAILIAENTGELVFQHRRLIQAGGRVQGLSAADFDNDGDLDVHACCYGVLYHINPEERSHIPIPLHDATNGWANLMLVNAGDFAFTDGTELLGLGKDNRRWSYASCWEDYDKDGDMDFYIANDFGPNQFYENQLKETGKPGFVDISVQAGVKDNSFGMGVSWGDGNRDGWQDLYVSNMFSGAGNRIAFQSHFRSGGEGATLAALQSMNQGNALYVSQPSGEGKKPGFVESAKASGVHQGRWAWGSQQLDLNNDGWLDLMVANGFITQPDTGDL